MAFLDFFTGPWSAPTLLALVALLGYFVGRLKRPNHRRKDRKEILRALEVSQEMEAIAYRLQRSLGSHLPAVERFSARLNRMERDSGVSWYDLCDRADELLKPVIQLGTEISHAYAELLQQMAALSSFAELRTDPLTGVANRRAFDESLANMLAQHSRYGAPVTLAMLDIDSFKEINDHKGHVEGDRVLHALAAYLKETVRDCDVLARYGGEEFAILMPYTELHASCNLTERIRVGVEQLLGLTVSIGATSARESDSPDDVISRADQALYAAKNSGRNAVFLHEGPPDRIVGIKTAPVIALPVADEPSVVPLLSPLATG